MGTLTVFTAPNCIDCGAVKNLLDAANIPYQEIDITTVPQAREALALLSGVYTVPQVFLGSKFLGQVAEIRYLVQTGQLQRLLAAGEPLSDNAADPEQLRGQ